MDFARVADYDTETRWDFVMRLTMGMGTNGLVICMSYWHYRFV